MIDYLAYSIATENGIEPSAIEKVAVPAMPARLEALKNNQIDAAILPAPFNDTAVADGGKEITKIYNKDIMISVFPIIVSIRDAVSNIASESYNPLISLGASKLQLFHHVTIPAILPEILTNIRLSIGTSFSVLFFAEAYGTSEGLGYFIQDAWSRINYIEMYSGIVMLSFLGLISFILIDFIESIVCRWKISS